MAVLYNQLDTDGSVKSGMQKPTVTTLLPSTTIQYSNVKGSVTYSGTLNTTNWVWTITSTGKVLNGKSYQSRTLKRSVTVRGLNVGADGSSWSRFYADSTRLVPDHRRNDLRDERRHQGQPLHQERRRHLRREHERRRRRHGDDQRPGPLPADQRLGLDELVQRLHDQRVERDERDQRGLHGLDAGFEGLRLRAPVQRDDQRDLRRREEDGEPVLQRRADDLGHRQPHGRHLQAQRDEAGRKLDGDELDRLQRERRDGPDRTPDDLRLGRRELHGRVASGNRRRLHVPSARPGISRSC